MRRAPPRLSSVWPLAGLIVVLAAPATAQQRTSATFEDWVVNCEIQAGPPQQKTCDMSQTTQAQGQGRNVPLSRAAIARPVKGQPVRLVIQLPVNVALQTPVRVQIGEKDPGMTVPFVRCVPGGCFAETDLKDDVLRRFRAAAAEPGRIGFKDAGEREVAVPLSFKGFANAFDQLSRE